MKTLKACLAAAAGLIVLSATFTLTDSGKAAAQPMKPLLVHVTNTTAEAVPVKTVLPAADRVHSSIEAGLAGPVRPLRHRSPEFCRTLRRSQIFPSRLAGCLSSLMSSELSDRVSMDCGFRRRT